jgi:hypothetical protein
MATYSNRDWKIDVALGEIVEAEGLLLRGFNPNVHTTWSAIWPTEAESIAYDIQATPSTVKISSDNANDTLAGTGAQTVVITGLVSGVRTTEIVSMDGQNVVTSGNTYSSIEDLIVVTVGSSGINEGTIYVGNGTVTAGVPVDKYIGVAANCNAAISLPAYTVPTGKRALVTSGTFSTTDSNKGFFIRIGILGTDGIPRFGIMIAMLESAMRYEVDYPLLLEAGEALIVEVKLASAPLGGMITALIDVMEETL